MIHGHITPEGKLVLESPNPTDQFALKCWFEKYRRNDSDVALEVKTAKEDYA